MNTNWTQYDLCSSAIYGLMINDNFHFIHDLSRMNPWLLHNKHHTTLLLSYICPIPEQHTYHLFITIRNNMTNKVTSTFTTNGTNCANPLIVFLNFNTSYFNSSSRSLSLTSKFSSTSSSFSSFCWLSTPSASNTHLAKSQSWQWK